MQEHSRRRFLQLTAGGVAVAGLGGIAATRAMATPVRGEELDENYRGHRIQIKSNAGNGAHGKHGADEIGSIVYIDGSELHVMRLDSGEYISSLSHYQPVRTLPEAARAAVHNLGSEKLRPYRT